MIKNSRFTIFTGKGGVGKTALSHSYTMFLKSQGINASLCEIDALTANQSSEKENIPRVVFSPEKSAEIYIGRKLHSTFVAKLIMKTSFFKALFQIIPSLAHMIVLGHIIDYLEKNPTEYLVLDAPATGHMITMLESPQIFQKIFKQGIIFRDIERMISFFQAEGSTQTFIIAKPGALPENEALELNTYIDENIPYLKNHSQVIMNLSMNLFLDEIQLSGEELPSELFQQGHQPLEALPIAYTFPFVLENIIPTLSRYWEKF